VTTFSEAVRTSRQSGVNRFSQLKGWFGRSWRAVAPGARAWTGAAYGLLLTVLLVLFVAFYNYFGAAGPATFVVGALVFLAASALIGSLLRLLAWLVRKIPYGYGWVLTVTLRRYPCLPLPIQTSTPPRSPASTSSSTAPPQAWWC